MKVLPGLSKPFVDAIYEQLSESREFSRIRTELRRLDHPQLTWPASGGVRATTPWLEKLGAGVSEIADHHGWPDTTSRNYSGFDLETSIFLAEYLNDEIPLGECIRPDFWSYLAAALLPDVSLWRFPGLPRERLEGGIRNVFRRLWWRAFLLERPREHSDRWGLLREMSEDGLVALTERPSISANPKLARAFGESWVRAANKREGVPMEELARQAAKFLTARNVIVLLDALEEDLLKDLIDSIFETAKDSIESRATHN